MEFKDFEKVLKEISKMPWKTDIKDKEIFEIANKNFDKLTSGYTKKKHIIRIFGQSGSGKTTQLLPSAKAYSENKGLKPIIFNVRTFAKYHPDYENLKNKFGEAKIREITNGFALKLMFIYAILAVNSGFDIILEVTLISHEFEDYLAKKVKENGYSVLFLCVAVNKKISDKFIENRQKESVEEFNREVNRESSKYFDEILEKSLKFIRKTFENEKIIIWNAFDELPVYQGNLNNCLETFLKERMIFEHPLSNKDKLLEAKINYIKNYSKIIDG